MFAIENRSTLIGTQLLKLDQNPLRDRVRQGHEFPDEGDLGSLSQKVTLFTRENRINQSNSFFKAYNESQKRSFSSGQEESSFSTSQQVVSNYRKMDRSLFIGSQLDISG